MRRTVVFAPDLSIPARLSQKALVLHFLLLHGTLAHGMLRRRQQHSHCNARCVGSAIRYHANARRASGRCTSIDYTCISF